MTSREIINALVRCTGVHTSTTCLDCPYSARGHDVVHFGEDFCKDALLRDSLNLITHQNAIKSKVIKDFAERVKSENGNGFLCSWYESADVVVAFDQDKFDKFIDNIVKELLESE